MIKREIFKRLLFIPAVFFIIGGLFAGERYLANLNLRTADRQASVSICRLRRKTQELLSVKNFEDTVFTEGLIDLNTATAEELDTIKGIGPKRAEAIVNQRQKMGGFYSVDDVLCTRGIGVKTEKSFKDKVYVTR